jgi:hypothetical protein
VNVQTFVAIAGIILFYLWAKRQQAPADDPEPPYYDAARLQGKIAELYAASKELEKLDTMRTDLNVLKPGELHRAFRVQWLSSNSALNHDFMAIGDDDTTTARLLDLANDEREKINSDIQNRISELYTLMQTPDVYEIPERSEQICEQIDPEPETEGECEALWRV